MKRIRFKDNPEIKASLIAGLNELPKQKLKKSFEILLTRSELRIFAERSCTRYL